jgi:Tol biopolymer transport system component
MRKHSASQSGLFRPRVFLALSLCSTAALLAMFALATPTSTGPYSRPGVTVKMLAANAGSTFSNSPVAVSADGRFVAFGGAFPFGCCVVGIYDRQTGVTDTPAVTDGGYLSLSANGRYLAYSVNAYDNNGVEDVYVLDRQTGTNTWVSVAPDGSPPTCDSSGCVFSSWYPSISADGRYVAFYSFASNLVSGDTNQTADVFVRDMVTGVTERVSVASDGTQANGLSVEPSISADGRYVAFRSFATNLVSGNTNTGTCAGSGQTNPSDVYVHDRQTGTTELVSVGMSGTQDGCSWQPSISGDGRFVAFVSAATSLIPSDNNAAWDVFVRDRQIGRTERVSVTPSGTQGSCPTASCRCGAPSITPDGRYVAFHSFAALVSDDANGTGDIFIHDRETGSTERVSLAYPGEQVPGEPPGNANSTSGPNAANGPAVSADGRITVFDSFAADLVLNDGWNNPSKSYTDVFLRDRGNAVGIGSLSASCSAKPATASGWATFSGGLLASADDPPNDGLPPAASVGAELIGASVAYRPEQADLFVRLPVTSLLANVGGAPGVLYGLKITTGGIPYEVRATQSEGFALYNCQTSVPTCTQVATLSGSMGATGSVVTVSVPLSALGVGEGSTLSGLDAYTALGSAAAGPGAMLDDVSLPSTVIPTHSVLLGIAPTGTPQSQVVIDTPATVTGGNFSGNLPPVPAGSYTVWAKACLGNTCGNAVSTPLNVTDTCAAPPMTLISVVSRKVHGSAGTFDIDLPFSSSLPVPSPGIECRAGGGTGRDHTLVFTFSNTPVSGSASVVNGTGSVNGSPTFSGNTMSVNLTGVDNAQQIGVTVSVTDNFGGNFTNPAGIPVYMGVLLGDVDATGRVDGNDVSAVQSHTRQSTDNTNYRYDVDTNGRIDGNDVSATQADTRTSLP